MQVKSTINPLTRSVSDVPIVLLCHAEESILIVRPETYEELVQSARARFALACTPTFHISSLDVCKGNKARIDEGAYEVLAARGLLDEILVSISDLDASNARDAGDAKDAKGVKGASDAYDARHVKDARNAEDAKDAKDAKAAKDAKGTKDAQDERNLVRSTSESSHDDNDLKVSEMTRTIDPQVLGSVANVSPTPSADTQSIPLVPKEGSTIKTGKEVDDLTKDIKKKQTSSAGTGSPYDLFADDDVVDIVRSRDGSGKTVHHEGGDSERFEDALSVPSHTDGEMVEVVEEKPSKTATIQKPKFKPLASVFDDNKTKPEERISVKTDIPSSSKSTSPKKPFANTSPSKITKIDTGLKPSVPANRRDVVPSPAKSPSKTRIREDPEQDDPRFKIQITGPRGLSGEFMTRGKHPVRKVLAGACKSFDLDYDSSRLFLVRELDEVDENGHVLEEEVECPKEWSMGQAGVGKGAVLFVKVDGSDDDEEEEEDEEDGLESDESE